MNAGCSISLSLFRYLQLIWLSHTQHTHTHVVSLFFLSISFLNIMHSDFHHFFLSLSCLSRCQIDRPKCTLYLSFSLPPPITHIPPRTNIHSLKHNRTVSHINKRCFVLIGYSSLSSCLLLCPGLDINYSLSVFHHISKFPIFFCLHF